MPTQNPPNPFPAWRLKNGVKKATNGELEAAVDSCERWGWGCGGTLLVGLVAELALAAVHPAYDSFGGRWVATLADFLVALGVAGEIQFSTMGYRRHTELQRRSDIKVEEARARVAYPVDSGCTRFGC